MRKIPLFLSLFLFGTYCYAGYMTGLDNLGNHIATKDLNMNGYNLNNAYNLNQTTITFQNDLATEVSNRQQGDLALGLSTATLQANIDATNVSTGTLVKKSGDTMTGQLTVSSSVVITGSLYGSTMTASGSITVGKIEVGQNINKEASYPVEIYQSTHNYGIRLHGYNENVNQILHLYNGTDGYTYLNCNGGFYILQVAKFFSGSSYPSSQNINLGDTTAGKIGETTISGRRYILINSTGTNASLTNSGHYGIIVSTRQEVGINKLPTDGTKLDVNGNIGCSTITVTGQYVFKDGVVMSSSPFQYLSMGSGGGVSVATYTITLHSSGEVYLSSTAFIGITEYNVLLTTIYVTGIQAYTNSVSTVASTSFNVAWSSQTGNSNVFEYLLSGSSITVNQNNVYSNWINVSKTIVPNVRISLHCLSVPASGTLPYSYGVQIRYWRRLDE